MELSIDTSTAQAGIALSDRGELKAEISWQAGQNHTVELVPQMTQLFNQYGTDIHHVKAITVASGPGSFNGLRVGMATAKGLAFALNIPMACISTLEVIAFSCANGKLPIRPIVQAGRGEIATAVFRISDGVLVKDFAEHITTIDNLCSATKERSLFCGEITPGQIDQIQLKLGELAVIAGNNSSHRVTYLAKLGWCRIEKGEFEDPSIVQPLYLKKPSITKPRRRNNNALSSMWP